MAGQRCLTVSAVMAFGLATWRLVSAFEVRVALSGAWPETPGESLALELLRRIDASEAASLLIEGARDLRGEVRRRLSAVPPETLDFLEESRFLSPAVEAARVQCRRDRSRYLPRCRGPFSLRRAGGLITATCLRDGSTSSSAGATLVRDGEFVVSERFGPRTVEVVLCAPVAAAANFLPSDADLIAYRYDDDDDGALSPGNGSSAMLGHVVELRVKKSEYSASVEETPAAAMEDDDTEGLETNDGGGAVDSLERSASLVELSESQLGNLPLQFCRLLLRSRSPLSRWREISENFPAFLKGLAMSKRPSKRVARELSVSRRQKLAINGRVLPDGFREAPFFYIVEKVLDEVIALERRARGAAWEAPSLAAGNGVTSGATLPRLDWRKAALTWQYHVKKDEEAEEWPSRITALAKQDSYDDMMGMAAFGGNAAQRKAEIRVRLPLVSVIIAFRPDDPLMLEVVADFLRTSLAGKVSLLPFELDAAPPPEWDADAFGSNPVAAPAPRGGDSDLRRILASGVVHAARHGEAPAFIDWLLKQQVPWSVDVVKEGFLKHGDASKKKATAAWKTIAQASKSQAQPSSDVLKLGVPVPSVAVNGRLVFSGAGAAGASAVLSQVRGAIIDEQRRFVDAVRAGDLKKGDEKAIESFALAAGGASAAPPPHVALERRPQSRLPPVSLPTARGRGSGSREVSATLFLRSPEGVAWLYPLALWLRRFVGPYSLAAAMSSDLPSRGCIAALLAEASLDSIARLAFGALHNQSHGSFCEGVPTNGAEEFAAAEAKVAMAVAPLPASGVALYCNGYLFELPLPVPRHAAIALERLACQVPESPPSQDVWGPELANISAVAGVRERGGGVGPAWLQVRGIADPLAEESPRVAAALEMLVARLGAEVAVQLRPNLRLLQTPLQKFTRSALPGAGPLARFADLETEDVLTAELVVPDCWVVTSLRSTGHDLDNLRKADVPKLGGVVEVEYLLQGVYVEGSALHNGEPLSGLQLELLDGDSALGESIVMKNFGYFAMEGRFGVVAVRAKPGPPNETFALASDMSVSSPSALVPGGAEDEQPLVLDSLLLPRISLTYRLRPKRKASDLFDKTIGSGRRSQTRRNRGSFNSSVEGSCPTIHVFSVASGHLYEKLLRVMMASVRKTTKCPVRFWFFDRFMSPEFKTTMSSFASGLNVTFEFVAFKWPSWLRDDAGAHYGIRGDKQRLIWAHKILFLDVIFPLDLQRVIFVDADLVVRGDLLELYTMDLEGAPYAFTPFCSGDRANPDTTGYRFWDSGFWKSHLDTLPYHISALFVVDLVQFRRLGVGDTLRSIYHGMAGDPNSLSNLDQDLPNYAQRTVPIFPLPEEWLWCESWCSQGSKPRAKAIDLCQNPKTKEPKISMARRVVEEWAETDAWATQLVADGAAASRAEPRAEL